MSDLWNKCDVCGRLISYDDFATGVAKREMVTPDSEFSSEEFETLCKMHRNFPAPTELRAQAIATPEAN